MGQNTIFKRSDFCKFWFTMYWNLILKSSRFVPFGGDNVTRMAHLTTLYNYIVDLRFIIMAWVQYDYITITTSSSYLLFLLTFPQKESVWLWDWGVSVCVVCVAGCHICSQSGSNWHITGKICEVLKDLFSEWKYVLKINLKNPWFVPSGDNLIYLEVLDW